MIPYPGEYFFKESIIRIFKEKNTVLDIGGGLRIDSRKNNRENSLVVSWIEPYKNKTKYIVSDVVDTFNPDVVLDVECLALDDASQDSIICMSILEHVKDPIKSTKEIYRVLKPGGYAFIYVPFLYYYHAESGYYKDYWRFSHDVVEDLFKDFKEIKIQNVRGALETWIRNSPLGRFNFFLLLSRIVDKIFGKDKTVQTSGYYVFLIK